MNGFSATGSDLKELNRACVLHAVKKLSALKNIALSPAETENLVNLALELSGEVPAVGNVPKGISIDALYPHSRDRLPTAVHEANVILDSLGMANLYRLIAAAEGKDWCDPELEPVASAVMSKLEADAPDRQCLRWPDLPRLAELVKQHYAGRQLGPVSYESDDGSVLTIYSLNGQLHRDPSAGPALQWAHGEKRGAEYRVNGELHRPHEDGPAMIYSPFRNLALSGEEYFENGKHHRPSHLGPAVRHWDDAGQPMVEVYYEEGELHRDAAQGPALWCIRDARTDPKIGRPCTEIKYHVRGKRHRDAADGPAMIVRDNETGVIVDEQYWRHGKRHREGGPARIRRDETGKVIFEGWYRDGQLHRDHNEGPALIDEAFDGLEIHCEEYHENGTWHRPSEIGPAILNTDRAGEVLREFYVEHGQLHRDPKKGPAWFEIRDARTVKGAPDDTTIIKYALNGKSHRDEADGPAITRRHNPTGVLLQENYDRDGSFCRMRGPAIIERDATGAVIFEAWCRGNGFHRDPREGPAAITHDRESGITTEEFFVDGEKLRDASIAPFLIRRDGSGRVIDEQFWDGHDMQVRPSETMKAEASAHG